MTLSCPIMIALPFVSLSLSLSLCGRGVQTPSHLRRWGPCAEACDDTYASGPSNRPSPHFTNISCTSACASSTVMMLIGLGPSQRDSSIAAEVNFLIDGRRRTCMCEWRKIQANDILAVAHACICMSIDHFYKRKKARVNDLLGFAHACISQTYVCE